MSERIYLLLLRLYPRRFRGSYGEEALQLFRDRMRDETGLLHRARLWFDLLGDLAAIHIRGYHETAAVASPAGAGLGGVPTFRSLDESALEPRVVFLGGFLAVVFCGGVLATLGSGGRPVFGTSFGNAVGPASKSEAKIVFSYEPAHPVAGSVVRLSATVSGVEGGPEPTGRVRFIDGWIPLADGDLLHGSVTVEAKLPGRKALPLNAIYLGDVNYLSANTVKKAR